MCFWHLSLLIYTLNYVICCNESRIRPFSSQSVIYGGLKAILEAFLCFIRQLMSWVLHIVFSNPKVFYFKVKIIIVWSNSFEVTVSSRNLVDLSFPTLVFLVRLSLKFYLINLKDSSTMFQDRLCFKVDYVSWNYGIFHLCNRLI